ncbi:MAG: lysophospholipid acyltransferase family protein [candidate division FCPU426 bacterium]
MYRGGFLLSAVWMYLGHRLRVHHRKRIPNRGGFILASNHASMLDPNALGVAICKRELHFMARSTLFKPAWFGWLLRSVNSHPIVRGNGPDQDWDAFVRLVQSGRVLLIFPEGTRTEDGNLQRGKSGFGRLVHLARVPVYTAYIEGSFAAWPKGGKFRLRPVTVTFGNEVPLQDLLDLPGEKRVLRQISDRVMEAIGRLREEALREAGIQEPASTPAAGPRQLDHGN